MDGDGVAVAAVVFGADEKAEDATVVVVVVAVADEDEDADAVVAVVAVAAVAGEFAAFADVDFECEESFLAFR